MRACARVALVSLVMSVGGLAGCGSLDKLSDTTTGWLVPPESPAGKNSAWGGAERALPLGQAIGDKDGGQATREERQAGAQAAAADG